MGSDDFFNTNGAVGYGGEPYCKSSNSYTPPISPKNNNIINNPVINNSVINKTNNMMYYLHVPFKDKDIVKSQGALWDKFKKQWYIKNENKELIEKYGKEIKKYYIVVPFKYKDIAKNNGALWDQYIKQWYVNNIDDKKKILDNIKDLLEYEDL